MTVSFNAEKFEHLYQQKGTEVFVQELVCEFGRVFEDSVMNEIALLRFNKSQTWYEAQEDPYKNQSFSVTSEMKWSFTLGFLTA